MVEFPNCRKPADKHWRAGASSTGDIGRHSGTDGAQRSTVKYESIAKVKIRFEAGNPPVYICDGPRRWMI